MKYQGIEVAGQQVLEQEGCYRKIRYWLKGWHYHFGWSSKFIHGLTGKETEITVHEINPHICFEVK